MTTKVNPWGIHQLDLSAPVPPRWRGSHRWGGWKLDEDHIYFGEYGFDLSDTTSSACVLDMVCQIAGKSWATDECLAGLVRALDDIFHPQALLCSCGYHKRITTAHAHDRIRRAAALLEDEATP